MHIEWRERDWHRIVTGTPSAAEVVITARGESTAINVALEHARRLFLVISRRTRKEETFFQRHRMGSGQIHHFALVLVPSDMDFPPTILFFPRLFFVCSCLLQYMSPFRLISGYIRTARTNLTNPRAREMAKQRDNP